ncbi:MAG TPA: AAA family ATPase [Trebonia sp.]|nr:AAA family ATPase [Trebonia sp.]
MGAEARGQTDRIRTGTSRQVHAGEQLVSPALVGRDEELGRLVAAVLAVPAVAVVAGEAGVGKTRLVEELLASPLLSDRRTLVGRCRPIREPFPLGAVVDAVRGLGEDLAGLALGPVTGALRPLVPELAPWLPAAPESLDDSQAERHRVFRGLLELLTALSAARRLVIVLEDVHWADVQTREFIAYWLSAPAPRVALVITYRSEDADVEVSALTARVPRPVGHEHVTLAPLDAPRTGALTAAILGTESVSDEFASYLWERTGGLPLAIEEVLALVRARGLLVHQGGAWARKALDELDVPQGIRDPTLQRVAGLSPAARRATEAAAVLRVPSPLPVLLNTVGRLDGPGEATDAIDQAIDSGLLVEDGDLIGFRHVLAAEAVYENLSQARRRALHRRAADALRGTSPGPLGRIAYHLKHAADLEAWAAAAEAAADQAVALGDEEEAVRLLTEALAAAPLTSGRRASLAIKLGWAALDTLQASAVIGPVSVALEQSASPHQRAEMQFLLALALGQAGQDLERQRGLLAEAVLNLDGRPDLLAWARLAMAIVSPPDIPQAEDVEWLSRALDALAEVSDRRLRVFVLGKAASLLVLFGDPAWREVADQAVRITGDAPRQRREANAYYSIGLEACYAGHLLTAERLLTKGLQAAAAQENRRIEMLLRSGLAVFHLFRGTWAGLPEETAQLRRELDEYALGRLDVELVSGCLALARGDLGEAGERLGVVTLLVRETGAYEVLPVAAGYAARLAVARGDMTQALASLDILRGAVEAKGCWPTACWVLPSAVETWLSAGQQAEARRFLDRAEAGLRMLDAPLAPAALCYGRGILTESVDDLTKAADLYAEAQAPYEAARAREHGARLLLAAGHEDAPNDLRRVAATYLRLGATWDYSRVAGLARGAGIRVPSPGRPGRKGYGPALSPQERKVAELAATGRTNQEIAAELFLSPKTVDKHLVAALRKLHARNRTELAQLLDKA